MWKTKRLAVASAITIIMSGALVPLAGAQAGSGSGGGSVNNALPTVELFSAAAATVNAGTDSVLSGSVKDQNKEGDLQSLKVQLVSGPVSFTPSERAIVSGDLSQTTPPSVGADGWQVWNPSGNADGILDFAFTYSYNTAGTYTWQVSVQDEGLYETNLDNSVPNVVVEAKEVISVFANMVDAAGADDGALWGGWSGEPGASALTSNYVKVKNTGTTATQAFTVTFSANALTADPDNGDSIDLTSNIKYVCVEKPVETDAPGIPDFSSATTGSGLGGIQCDFSGAGNFMYVAYEIQSIPDVIAEADYQASFTVDPV